jgi:hypothetical protein
MGPAEMRQYAIITGSYWAFTLTDGALRMLVVLYFHQLGYAPLAIALLFLFYEVFGVLTNLVGGWLAARLGLATTLIAGLILQVIALAMLLVDEAMLGVLWVMAAQGLSGIAKDLNKMSAKSSVKLIAGDAESRLYKWTAALTGSKNALKGAGFFMGGALLATVGFRGAIGGMATALALVAVLTVLLLDRKAGKASFKPRFSDLVSRSPRINRLSLARLFLFGARDVWFVVALPVFLQSQLGWSGLAVGSLLAVWIVGYGSIQGIAPLITGVLPRVISGSASGHTPDGTSAWRWGLALTGIPTLVVVAMVTDFNITATIIVGLLAFGVVFAINSAVHSYLIVSYAGVDGVSLDVGFYYMSNAMGRLLGTLLSGGIYQLYGLEACLLMSTLMVGAATIVSVRLPANPPPKAVIE